MQAIKLKNEPSYKALHDAFDYQRRAVDFVKDLDSAAVFHEQGLGKSKIAIDLALTWIKEKQLDTILIITKKSLVQNWINEFAFHSYINPKTLSGNAKQDGNILLSPARVIVCHYEVVKRLESSIMLFCETRSVGVFLDESQKIKNPESSVTKSLFRLAKFFKKKVIVTGTPIANRPYDIWSQIYFLDTGESLGYDFKKFKNACDLTNDLDSNDEKKHCFVSSISKIYPKIKKLMIRETKLSCSIDLPNKNYKHIYSQWEARQWDMYNDVKTDFRTHVMQNNNVVDDTSVEILKRILRLQQICSTPQLIDDSYKSRPGKMNDLDEILFEISSRDEKVIIWTQFTGTADYLVKHLGQFKAKKLTGKMSIDKRNSNIDLFKKDHDVKCLVATYGAAKEGLTLTVANNAIFFDRSLSLDDYVQSQDRIHRISQNFDCNFYVLEMENSIESWVDRLLNAKMCSANFALRDIDSELYAQYMTFDFGDALKKSLGVEYV